ncbi:hypothetical protein LGH82_01135 [Mesorhizobium sp. PAMC28654]|uniref:hypothetical protein n=1 Tax=Mesorhizobium sp. PAMC28654 TaxID=2880934 RepID=UPI001D09EF93|nr:hypothetical protein [Mesorhizobium sp. PAMC28654]UDL90044.1 hypothetical protein LGH82_01135 [Mesorhizobium sp. PAMC28654]
MPTTPSTALAWGAHAACRLPPRDRLASVAAVLKEIREGLERRSARKGTPGPNTEPGVQNHSQDRARLPG